jgi:Xaa-Pro aminopeptidase
MTADHIQATQGRDLMGNHVRLRALMRDRGLDALVAGTPENVFYLSGVRLLMQRLIPNRFSFVLLTADSSMLITVHSDADHARRDATVDAVLEYGHTDPPIKVLSQAIADAGLGRGRIGMETGFIPVAEFTALSQSLPGGELVAADEIFQQVRMRKSFDEIECLRRAQHQTELAVTAAMAMSGEGDTERAMAQKIGANFFASGAEAVDFILLTIGINSTVFHLLPGSYRARRGDVVHLDVGGSFDNYRSDLSRNVGIGQITMRQRDIYARLWDVQRSLIADIRPGVTVRDIVRQYLAAMQHAGLEPPGDHLGHGIGLASHEFPELTLECDIELVTGMILAIEPTTFVPGDARYDIEDVVAVTDAGSEMLSGTFHQREMWVV